jgi:hypothetical protein
MVGQGNEALRPRQPRAYCPSPRFCSQSATAASLASALISGLIRRYSRPYPRNPRKQPARTRALADCRRTFHAHPGEGLHASEPWNRLSPERRSGLQTDVAGACSPQRVSALNATALLRGTPPTTRCARIRSTPVIAIDRTKHPPSKKIDVLSS